MKGHYDRRLQVVPPEGLAPGDSLDPRPEERREDHTTPPESKICHRPNAFRIALVFSFFFYNG